MSASDGKIYCVNKFNYTVTCNDMTGQKLWTFSDASTGPLYGISANKDKNVFVVGNTYSNLAIVGHNGKEFKTLLTSADSLHHPGVICFNDNTNVLSLEYRPGSIALYRVT